MRRGDAPGRFLSPGRNFKENRFPCKDGERGATFQARGIILSPRMYRGWFNGGTFCVRRWILQWQERETLATVWSKDPILACLSPALLCFIRRAPSGEKPILMKTILPEHAS